MQPWLENRVPCRFCGEVVVAVPRRKALCSCGKTVVRGDENGNALNPSTQAFPEWDLWAEDRDVVVVAAPSVDAAIRRAELDGRPVAAVLAVWTSRRGDREEKPTYGGIAPTVVGCADAENGNWPDSPMAEHMDAILSFGRRHGGERILIHCSQGMGRAPAAALAILADRLGPGREDEALSALLHLRPCAIINYRMAGLADQVLGREGELLGVVKHHPLIRARHSARQRDYGWEETPTLLMPNGGSEDLSRW